ncbi:siderophore-interacting protein [Nonomuraea jabiensis]|uniref:siderophore-interacting protein n=1 Tax=Nonomuraea jabiensis TaxID=882448 RepID=UPI003D740291
MSEKSPAFEGYEAHYHVAGVCQVVRAELLTPRMRRITLHGQALAGLERHWRPEMLVRLYFPPQGHDDPPEPFINDDHVLEIRTPPGVEVSPFSAFSEDPLVRAFTGRRYRAESLELDVDFVLHEAPGLASDWVRTAKPGDRLGVVEFNLPPGHRPAAARGADTYVLFADEAALPALQTNLEAFAPETNVRAFVEVTDESEQQSIESPANVEVTWLHRGDAQPGTTGLLVSAARDLEWPQGNVFVWACCDIKAATQIRQFITKERGMQKGTFKVQAYWRRGKTEVERMARMTEVALASAENSPVAFQESFESIGMSDFDPTVFEDATG